MGLLGDCQDRWEGVLPPGKVMMPNKAQSKTGELLASLSALTAEVLVQRQCRELVALLFIQVRELRPQVKDKQFDKHSGLDGGQENDPRQSTVAMQLHSCWNELAEEYGVEVCPSLTDNFIAVCGHDGNTRMATRMARFAMAAVHGLRVVLKENRYRGIVSFGMHCGSVYFKMHGVKNPRMSLFGDTLAMAQSLANSSVNAAGERKVHMSERATIELQREKTANGWVMGESSKNFKTSSPLLMRIATSKCHSPEVSAMVSASASNTFDVAPRGLIKIKVLGKVQTSWLVFKNDDELAHEEGFSAGVVGKSPNRNGPNSPSRALNKSPMGAWGSPSRALG